MPLLTFYDDRIILQTVLNTEGQHANVTNVLRFSCYSCKLFCTQKKAIRGVMPGFANNYYKDGKLPTHTKHFFASRELLTVQNIILKNILVFFHSVHHSPELLPQAIIQLIDSNAPNPDNSTDHNSSWYTTYSSHPFNKSIFFKGPILYTDIMTNHQELCLPFVSKASYKRCVKKCLLNIQKSGDNDEWESTNFKLTSLAGLRRSKRIAEQGRTTF